VQPNILVEIYRKYLADNTERKVAQDVTDPEGRIKNYLKHLDTYYRFNLWDEAKTDLKLNTSLMRMFSETLTLKIGAAIPKGWDVYYALRKATGNVTWINSTKSFQLKWDYTDVPDGNFTIENTCLYLDYINNVTGVKTNINKSCTTGNTGTITLPANSSLADQWLATGYVNITASPPLFHVLDSLGINLATLLGTGGVFWGLMIVVLAVGAGITAGGAIGGVVSAAVVFAMLIMTSILPFGVSLIITLAVFAIFIMIILRMRQA